jgi:CRISPR system Cascade subunit CasA
LAAIVLERQGVSMAEAALATEGDWAGWLRDLSGGRDEAWSLVVEDLALPAVFQPGLNGEALSALKESEPTANALDTVDSARNHDVKIGVLANARAEQWLYALCALQTTVAAVGPVGRPARRLGGGWSDRPMVSYAPSRAWGQRFRREVSIALASRNEIVDRGQTAETNGIALLWTEQWDGTQSLPLSILDPYCIEVARRVRLAGGVNEIRCHRVGTATFRIEPSAVVPLADPWTPIAPNKEGTGFRCWSVGDGGLTYKKVAELLFPGGEIVHGASHRSPGIGDHMLIASVHAKDGGKKGASAGLFERVIPVPAKIMNRLRGAAPVDALAGQARARVATAAEARKRILRPALLTLQRAGRSTLDKKDYDSKSDEKWVTDFDQRVDQAFFDQLWQDADLDGATADARWKTWLLAACEAVLEAAIAATPYSGVRRYRAIAAAEHKLRQEALNYEFRSRTAKLAEENAQ